MIKPMSGNWEATPVALPAVIDSDKSFKKRSDCYRLDSFS